MKLHGCIRMSGMDVFVTSGVCACVICVIMLYLLFYLPCLSSCILCEINLTKHEQHPHLQKCNGHFIPFNSLQQ